MPATNPIGSNYGSSVKSASRKRKDGGGVVEEKKDGGAVEEKKKDGGAVERKFGGAVSGAKAALRLDRPGRKTGGRVGADKAPMSSAASASCPPLSQQH
jgi:hypothetical protein